MIVDNIEFVQRYSGLGNRLIQALAYLQETDLLALEPGQYEIVGEDLYCIVDQYSTRAPDEGKLEGHKKYIDVQCVISGSEMIGYAPLGEQEVIRSYDSEHDYALYGGEASFVRMVPGMFAIFFPNDLHMPGISQDQQQVKKIAIKVKV